MNIKTLENRLRRLDRKISALWVDFDDPRYAIYIRGECILCHKDLEHDKYDLIPVNKAAQNYEIEKIQASIDNEDLRKFLISMGIKPHFWEEELKIKRLKRLPIETNKKIHVDNSYYLIYKFKQYQKRTYLAAYNDAAKENSKTNPPMKEVEVRFKMSTEKEKKRLHDLGFNIRYEYQKTLPKRYSFQSPETSE